MTPSRFWTFNDPGWRRGIALRAGRVILRFWRERRSPRRLSIGRTGSGVLFAEVFGLIATAETRRARSSPCGCAYHRDMTADQAWSTLP